MKLQPAICILLVAYMVGCTFKSNLIVIRCSKPTPILDSMKNIIKELNQPAGPGTDVEATTGRDTTGLRFTRDKNGELIDQYGRIFSTDEKGRPLEPTGRCGYATH